jgi:hypothetical protein
VIHFLSSFLFSHRPQSIAIDLAGYTKSFTLPEQALFWKFPLLRK